MYPAELVQPMKEDLTHVGFKQLTSITDVDQTIQQAEGTLLEVPTNGLVWTEWISKRYKHLEVALYSELKGRLPDCSILVKIQEETWFFCFRYIRLKVSIKW